VEDVKQAVIAGYERYLAAFAACGAVPSSCNPGDFTLPGGRAEANLKRFFGDLAAAGHRVATNPERDRWTATAFTLAERPGEALLTTCAVDAGVVYDTRSTPPLEDDVVVDDSVSTVVSEWTFVATGQGWTLRDNVLKSQEPGESC
jgi:hypothetical protein